VKARAVALAGQAFVTQRYRPDEGLERLEALLAAPPTANAPAPRSLPAVAGGVRPFVPVLGKNHRGGSL
jgi:hypothetical protein